MQTLFVVKVSCFGLRQFTLNPTTREGVRKAEEEAPEEAEEEGDRNNDDASGDDDTEAEGHRNQDANSDKEACHVSSACEDRDHDPSPDGEGAVYEIQDPRGGEGGDPVQAKWKNHLQDSAQKALKVPDRDHFPAYLQPHKLERMLIQS
jgi:hypothetical protein